MMNPAYWRYKAAGTCVRCGKKRVPNSVYCAPHQKYHRDHARGHIRERRAADPDLRERERLAVRERMRRLRANPDYVRPDR